MSACDNVDESLNNTKDEAPMRLSRCKAGCNCFSPRSAVDHAGKSIRQKGSLKLEIWAYMVNERQMNSSVHMQSFKDLRLTATQTHRKSNLYEIRFGETETNAGNLFET